MKKKYISMAIAALLACGFASCNDWLDVQQNTEKKADHMFDNYDGFKGALAGCYSDLLKSDLYGTRLTMTDIEGLACLWSLDVGNSNYTDGMLTSAYFREHNYSHDLTETAIRSIYGAFYNTILEANMVIKACPEHGQNIPEEDSRAVVEGEAYAIRALCHFDLLRLFGQLPVNATTQVELPYSEVTSIEDPLVYYSFDEFVAKLESDLNKAESLMKDNDPVFQYTMDQLNNIGAEGYEDVSVEDDFMYSRQYRMNYWAVKALQARMYMYLGQAQKAHDIAMEVINATTASGDKVVELSSATDYGRPDTEVTDDNPRLFASPSECLFSLYVPDLYGLARSLLNGNKSSQAQGDRTYLLPQSMLNDLLQGLDAATDVRAQYLWAIINDGQQHYYGTTQKYYASEDSPSGCIPMLRLSEMYLIAVEGASTLDEANDLYATYMKSKGSSPKAFTTTEEMRTELEKEYRREFFAEGQMFYYYKRNNVKHLWSKEDVDMREADYILPVPNTEYNTNR